jgi:ribonuclease P protein component
MLARKYKLKKDNDFKRVFKEGKYYKKGFIKIRFLENDLKISRFGFIIGLKISKRATQRNKIKRQLEEIIRCQLKQIKSGFDIVFLPQIEILNKNQKEIRENLNDLLKEVELIL